MSALEPELENKLDRSCGSDAVPCSPSSLTPETDAVCSNAEDWQGTVEVVTTDFARKLERERNRYKAAIMNCLDWANGRQSEWGSRAENAFAFLDAALYPIPENDKLSHEEGEKEQL